MPGNRVRITAETVDKASSPLDKIKDKFEGLQKQGAKGFGIGVAAGATTFALNSIAGAADQAATAVIGFAQDSIDKASDLNETMSKAEVIFGDNAKAVEDWAGTMATSAGESKTAALDAASGFAGLFKTVGLGINQTTDMSKNLTQLGADLASFFNTDVGTALDALKSGLNGESEPLRQFNVFLSDTAVASKLASMGIKKVGGQFTEAQKATARYQLILEQTGDAQGDYVRTSDGLANSQRTLAAEVDNLQAEVGQELLPVLLDLTKWAKDEGIPAVHELFKEFQDGSGPIGMMAQGVNDLERDLNGLDQNVVGAGINIHNFLVDLLPWNHRLQDAADAAKEADDASRGLGDAAIAATAATKGMATSLDHGSEAAGSVAWSALGAKTATVKLKDANKELHHAYAPVIIDLRTVKEKFDDATDAIEANMFAVGEARRALQEHNLSLKDDIEHLRQLEKIKHPTRDQRLDILQTKDAIDDDKKAIIENTLKLRAMGKITYSNLVAQLKRIGLNILADTDAARALRLALLAADQAAGGRAGSGGHHGGGAGGTGVHTTPPPPDNGHGNAGGGNETKGMPRLVGEKGPELFTPESNGHTSPNANTMLGAGGVPRGTGASLTINGGLHLHGIGSDVSPAAAEHFGRRVLAEVAAGFKQGSARRGISVAVRP
jgi:hypothetical protein